MQFQVPQFIEVEDRIFGPFTVREFIYLAGGAGFTAMMITILPFYIALIVAFPIIILSAALAFYKVNNRPFVDMLQAAVSYFMNSRLYIWKKETKEAEQEAIQKHREEPVYVPKLSKSRLKDLAWSLDIKESVYSDNKQK